MATPVITNRLISSNSLIEIERFTTERGRHGVVILLRVGRYQRIRW